MFSESVSLLSLGTGGFTGVNHLSIVQTIGLAEGLFIPRSYAGGCLLTINPMQLLSLVIMPAQNRELNLQLLETIPTLPHVSDLLIWPHNIVDSKGTTEEKSRQL